MDGKLYIAVTVLNILQGYDESKWEWGKDIKKWIENTANTMQTVIPNYLSIWNQPSFIFCIMQAHMSLNPSHSQYQPQQKWNLFTKTNKVGHMHNKAFLTDVFTENHKDIIRLWKNTIVKGLKRKRNFKIKVAYSNVLKTMDGSVLKINILASSHDTEFKAYRSLSKGNRFKGAKIKAKTKYPYPMFTNFGRTLCR